ncbi:hypothetical protein CEXT_293751 [Caerostris extrusa]|uniref:Uncharacterized protein n=1 Tax=Caerostris extrusa TaxID=172846 RepID=A0AAV4Y7Q8_CAEEX|nr:hypothetical protein CEXT_293751 [Caerostris extrusa]
MEAEPERENKERKYERKERKNLEKKVIDQSHRTFGIVCQDSVMSSRKDKSVSIPNDNNFVAMANSLNNLLR